jgi:formylglycine-generating enzyme required for sulfatase activity
MTKLVIVAPLVAGCAFGDEFVKIDRGSAAGCEAVAVPTPKSCSGGSNKICGPSSNLDCCETLCVPAGSFKRGFDGTPLYKDTTYGATVSTFTLDKYEVTVGRVRAWITSPDYKPSLPAGAGAPPTVPAAGWRAEWDANLAANVAAFNARIDAAATMAGMPAHESWSEKPGGVSTERRPMNYIDWYAAFAFCVWDGGRLPSESEWHYAASGGSEQRIFPFSKPPNDPTINNQYAGFGCDLIKGCPELSVLHQPGSRLATGDGGRWGHADLAGNLAEWVLDQQQWSDETNGDKPLLDATYRIPCDDCVDLSNPQHRPLRGGNFFSTADEVRSSAHGSFLAGRMGFGLGFRCARDVKR